MRQGLTDSAQGTTSIDGTVDVDQVDETCLILTGTIAGAGATGIVGSGVGLRIVLSRLMIQNESAVATKVEVLEGAAAITQGVLQTQGSALSVTFPVGREYKFAANVGLSISLSAANLHNYTIYYYPEAA